MTRRIVAHGACAAALLSMMAAAATAQIAPQAPTQSPNPRGTQSPTATQSRPLGERSAGEQQITILGCVVNESEYRSASSQDRSSAATARDRGGDEFVLVSAAIAPAAAGAPSSLGGSTASSATGTSGSSGSAAAGASGSSAGPRAGGAVYSLTGDRESELSKYVGKRVEIVGTMDRDASSRTDGDAGAPDSRSNDSVSGDRGDRSGRPEVGAAASGSAPTMPRVMIVSFKPADGSCQ